MGAGHFVLFGRFRHLPLGLHVGWRRTEWVALERKHTVAGKVLGYTALSVLVVVDVALVGLALRTPTTTPVTSTAAVVPAPATTDTVAPTGTAGAAAVAPAPVYPIPASTLVSLGAEGQAMLASTGACDGTAAASYWSEDSGRIWLAQNTPAPVLGAIDITGKSAATVVGTNQECAEAQSYTTTSSVQDWTSGADVAAQWYVLPTSPAQIGGAAGQGASPCERTIALAPLSPSEAVVLCSTGAVISSTNGGATWRAKGVLLEARALAAVSPTTLVALQSRADCVGTGIAVSTNAGATWGPAACLAGFDASGPVGIDAQGNRVLAVAANGQSFLSEDAGATFTSLV